MAERKSRYREFCASAYVPIHLQPWWLDAVCSPAGWDVALATDAGGDVTGVLPYFKKRRWGLWVVQQAPFTTYAGPWLRYPETPNFKRQSRYTFEKKVMTELIAQLPKSAFFLQNFRPEVDNWLPFYWQGFQQTTRYTYIFDDTTDDTIITAGMKNTLRSDLKKAAQATTCQIENDAWELIFQLKHLNSLQKNQHQALDKAIFGALHAALAERNQMACFVARDRLTAAPHAALYLVADGQQASILLTGTDPAHKSSCAIYGLFLEAIHWCGQRHLSLDFEGSMLPEIEHTFRAFGARRQPYHQILKPANKFLGLLYLLLH